jgi:hypothetical protein
MELEAAEPHLVERALERGVAEAVLGDGDNGEVVLGQALRKPIEGRHFLKAGSAPGRSQVQDQHLAAIRFERNVGARFGNERAELHRSLPLSSMSSDRGGYSRSGSMALCLARHF